MKKELFEYHWGGEDTWYTKAERWAKKQGFPINHLALGLIVWLKRLWIEAKIEAVIRDVDRQAEEIKEQWDKEDEPQTVMESKPSEVEGLDSIRISHKASLPDPWDGDWNDAAVNYKSWNNESFSPPTE